jgi:glycosyltransferase involved in cell wall biosynthesis
MNVVMLTNTYLPHVGGVARSVSSFTEAFRRLGHRVLVIAPTFDGMPEAEEDVVRVPAIQHFNGSDFSVSLPVPGLVSAALESFHPHVLHAHHPFLLGGTAVRAAAAYKLPVVFTHHTLYEQYTHYVPGDSALLRRFAAGLATEYANLCDHVIAPSESVAALLAERGVTAPISAIPTGIDPERFAKGDGAAARARPGLPTGAFVVGHVGRLAPEKNLAFLARAVAAFLESSPDGHFLVVGSGPSEEEVRQTFEARGLGARLHLPGTLQGQELADAYHAMNVFAFASQSETQGMVLAEAMTAGVPVVAVDACGVREVVSDGVNGRLWPREDEAAFAAALGWVAGQDAAGRQALAEAARGTAREFALEGCARRVLDVYARLAATAPRPRPSEETALAQTVRLVGGELQLMGTWVGAAVKSLGDLL